MSGNDYEDEARQRVRREERGSSTPEENQALDWLASRLRTQPRPGQTDDDWRIAASWNSSHWPKLKAALEPIPAQDHQAIDRAFNDYARKKKLIIDIASAQPVRAFFEPPM